MSDLYAEYVDFKGWAPTGSTAKAYEHAALMRFAGVALKGARFLELGFGPGHLLDWAKDQGAETFGEELVPELVEQALDRGHHVSEPGHSDFASGSFDIIAAIDVLEHLQLDQLREILARVGTALRPGGVFIARFPNGQSPLSVPYQNGDLTHLRWLSPENLRQLAPQAGLKVVGVHNFRPRPPGIKGLKFNMAYAARDLVELALGYLYFGYRFPMDPNVVVVMTPSTPTSSRRT